MATPEELARKAIEERESQNPQNFQKPEVPKVTPAEATAAAITEEPPMEMSSRHEEMVNRVRSRGEHDSTRSFGSLRSGDESEIHGANDEFWKNIPMETLPTAGLFYPDGTEITIRSADVGEIRHWSTIDEHDFLDMDTKMNFIIEKCLRIKGPQGTNLTWKDVKEIDRFFLVFRIHEFTFPNGENKLFINFGCNMQCKGDGTYREKVHLQSNMLNLLNIPDELMQYYDPQEKCFVKHSTKLGETLRFYVPSIGVSQHIKNQVKEARNNNGYVDPSFVKVAPYLIKDWRGITEKNLESMRVETFKWNKNKLLFILSFTDRLENSVSIVVKKECPMCSTVLEAPLFFREGFTIKNLFIISTPPDDLV